MIKLADTARREMVTVEMIASRLGVSAKTVDRMVKRGEFPAPVRVSPHCIRWPASVVDEYLASLQEAAAD